MKSDRNFVSCGVPQSSVLGPLLFLLYVNDIRNSVPDIPTKLYADDTYLFVYGKTVENLINNARMYISKLNDLFIANELSLSIDKTCYSVFDVPDTENSTFKLCIELKQVKSSKYLGIIIDLCKNWSEHIDYLYKKLIKFTSIFYKLRNRLPSQLIKMVYFAFVHSQLSCGIEIYSNTYPKLMPKTTVYTHVKGDKLSHIENSKNKSYITISLHIVARQ